MKKITLFTVDDNYIDYLRQYDSKVLKHSGEDYTTSRKYLGVLFEINGFKYLAPLSSPSETYDFKDGIIRKSLIPIIRMVSENQLLGTIKLGCMIPIFDENLISYYDINSEIDLKYKILVRKELEFIYINKELILKNAYKLYQQKINNMSMGYIKNTVDFQLLEEKAKLYKKP